MRIVMRIVMRQGCLHAVAGRAGQGAGPAGAAAASWPAGGAAGRAAAACPGDAVLVCHQASKLRINLRGRVTDHEAVGRGQGWGSAGRGAWQVCMVAWRASTACLSQLASCECMLHLPQALPLTIMPPCSLDRPLMLMLATSWWAGLPARAISSLQLHFPPSPAPGRKCMLWWHSLGGRAQRPTAHAPATSR